MKYAIEVLKTKLSKLKSDFKNTQATEFKMDFIGKIEEIKKAIKILNDNKS